jgi:hypothetical protein
VRSLWRNLLAIPGCFVFVIVCLGFASFHEWWAGILAAILAFFPLVLLFEIVTRIRYPSIATPDTAVGEEN